MKTIIFLRHAKSSHTIEDIDDIHRPLNERGYKDAFIIADALKHEKVKPDVIISSPATRAITTALIFAECLKIKHHAIIINEMLYETEKAKIISLIKGLDNKLDCAMLVGHNPEFEETINSLLKSKIEKYPTTGVAVIQLKIEKWNEISHTNSKLTKLLLPSQFRGDQISSN